ncbi:MAG: organomercurial lyase [Gemmatimonadaceae bacterium]
MKNDIDTQIRVFVYDYLMAHGNPPAVAEIANQLSLTTESAKTRLASLKIGKTILVHPERGEVWMAGPFSAADTQYRVIGSRTSWWANCAWDMLGIAMINRRRC